jgi:hypothetical protein
MPSLSDYLPKAGQRKAAGQKWETAAHGKTPQGNGAADREFLEAERKRKERTSRLLSAGGRKSSSGFSANSNGFAAKTLVDPMDQPLGGAGGAGGAGGFPANSNGFAANQGVDLMEQPLGGAGGAGGFPANSSGGFAANQGVDLMEQPLGGGGGSGFPANNGDPMDQPLGGAGGFPANSNGFAANNGPDPMEQPLGGGGGGGCTKTEASMRKATAAVCLTPGCDQVDRNADGFCHLHQSLPNQAPRQLPAPNYQAPEGTLAELREQEAALYLQLIEGQANHTREGIKAMSREELHAAITAEVVPVMVQRVYDANHPGETDREQHGDVGLSSEALLNDDLDMSFDAATAQKIRKVRAMKERGAQNEAYDSAKRLKRVEEQLKALGAQLAQLGVEKQEAVKSEDYDRAKAIKGEMDTLRVSIEQTQSMIQDTANHLECVEEKLKALGAQLARLGVEKQEAV